MLITYGTGFYGKISSFKGQRIETKFFYLMFIPIFPLGSMYVTASEFRKRRGFDIDLNTKSVIAVYARMFTLVIAAFLLFLAYFNAVEYSGDTSMAIAYGIAGLVFALLWVYFWFYYGKATPADIVARNKMGSITGLYAQPHWLDYMTLRSLLDNFTAEYKRLYPDSDWKADLTSRHIDSKKYPLLYGLALFNCMVYDIPANDELYAKADGLYNPEIGSNAQASASASF